MMRERSLQTPQTHPDHSTVGRHFVGNCFRCPQGWHVFYCDSYEPGHGFWITRADCPPEHRQDQEGEWRRNVSEWAIGRSVHKVTVFENGFAASAWGAGGPGAAADPNGGHCPGKVTRATRRP